MFSYVMAQTVPLVLLAIAVSKVTCSPTNGDTRLVDGSSGSFGRLEVYLDNAWGTVCYDSTPANYAGQEAAALAVCRQLGFNNVRTVQSVTDAGIPAGTGSIMLGNVSCSVGGSLNDVTQHILRCSYSSNPSSGCTHGDDMAITCDSTSKYNSPYESEVRLTGGDFLSNGLLEIYLNGEWGTVCYDSFDSDAADTVCRQMGYTGSRDYTFTTDSNKRVWLSDVSCIGSQQCFSLCFSYPSYSYVPACDSNQRSVVNCTFDTTSSPPSAGYGSLCVSYLDLVKHILEIIIGAVVGGLIFLILIILIPVVVCCCCIPGCVLFGGGQRRTVVYEAI